MIRASTLELPPDFGCMDIRRVRDGHMNRDAIDWTGSNAFGDAKRGNGHV
jgi:hypothetical protein